MAAESRSVINPALNVVEMRRVADHFSFGDLTTRGLPHHFWHPVIHEFTHHWCFLTPVGTALHVAHVRQAERIAGMLDGEASVDAAQQYLHSALFVTDFILACLEPIAEGLAVFAEHDMHPGALELESMPGFWAHLLFARGEANGPRTVEQFDLDLALFLREARLSVQGVSRKASLLAEPFHSNQRYLGGYVLLKALQRHLSTTVDARFDNAAIYMGIVRDLFFNDFVLADMLLDSIDEHESTTTLAACASTLIVHRLRELLAGDHAALIDHQIQALENHDPTPRAPRGDLKFEDGTTLVERSRSGERRLRDEIDRLFDDDDEFSDLGARSLRQREAFLLYRDEFQLTTRDGLAIAATDRQHYPLMTAEQLGLPHDGATATGSFEIVVLPYRNKIVSFQAVDGAMVRTWTWLDATPNLDLGSIDDLVAERIADVDAQRRLAQTWTSLRKLLDGTTDGLTKHSVIEEAARTFYERNFLRIGLTLFAGDTELADRLNQSGSLGKAVGSWRLRRLAALGLVARTAPDRDGAAVLLAAVGEQFGEQWTLDAPDASDTTLEARVERRFNAWMEETILLPWM